MRSTGEVKQAELFVPQRLPPQDSRCLLLLLLCRSVLGNPACLFVCNSCIDTCVSQKDGGAHMQVRCACLACRLEENIRVWLMRASLPGYLPWWHAVPILTALVLVV